MDSQSRRPRDRIFRGLGALTAESLGRGSLLAAGLASFLWARSPGASLVFMILPVYAVLTRGDFSETAGFTEIRSGPSSVSPDEILIRSAAALLAVLAALAALVIGSVVAQRFRVQAYSAPWGLAVICVSASLLLSAVHLPFLAVAGPKAGRIAAGAVFAAAGIAAAVSAFPAGSLYSAFLLLLYSGNADFLYFPLIAGSAALATISAAASWGLSRTRAAGP